MDQEKITDRNVEQLHRVESALKNFSEVAGQRRVRSVPGSRPDGGMAPMVEPANPMGNSLMQQVVEHERILRSNLVDARNIIDNFERDMIKLESELAETKARLDMEKIQREHFEGMLREIARLVVNGAKEKP